MECLVRTFVIAFIASFASSSLWAAEVKKPEGQPIGSAGFNDMLGKQIKPGTLSVEEQPDGSFLLTNKLQTVSAHVTHKGVTFDSIGNSAGKGGFSLELGQWGREGSLHAVQSADIYKKDEAVYNTHTDGLAEKFTNTSGGIQQNFIVAVKPQGSGDLHIRLQVGGASVKQKDNGAIIGLNSGRQLTYDRLAVTDATGKTVPAEIRVATNNVLDVIVHDANAQYPLMIDPTVGDQNWVSMGSFGSGLDGAVDAIVIKGSNVYLGGTFTVYGNSVVLNYIAKWDGSSWSALGSGMNGSVTALAVDANGILYAGGNFTNAGSTVAKYIAKWDGSSWSALGSGMNGTVSALAVDGSGTLYAGGTFSTAGGISVNYIGKWDGANWNSLGTGTSGGVSTIIIDGNNNVYVGGGFSTAGGITVNSIARWDGSNWNPLGSGFSSCSGSQCASNVYSLVLDSQNNLYAGGYFGVAGGIAVNYVAEWNGSAWSALGSGVGNNAGTVYSLAIDSNGHLYAGGVFTIANGGVGNYIAVWNGVAWNALASGLNNQVSALCVDGAGNLFVGGSFTYAGNTPVKGIAMWNGAWNAPGGSLPVTTPGINGQVLAQAIDKNNNIYVGGSFTYAGGIVANYIAKWNGSSWSALGSGMNNSVNALIIDSNGNLYAAGAFTSSGGVTTNHIAKWNGSTWVSLGAGLNNTANSLTIDGSGKLYVGGSFTHAGSVTANCVAKWNGSVWSALSSGMSIGFPNTAIVLALATDSQNNLYAGGYFTSAGGNAANYIAKWNGSSWSALGSGMNGQINTLAIDSNGNIYAGGGFSTAGGITVNNIALWNGSTWSALGSGVNDTVYAMVLDGHGSLYVAGSFWYAGGIVCSYFAKWNGSSWSSWGANFILGQSSTGTGYSPANVLSIDSQGNIIIGGSFNLANIYTVNNIVKWDGINWIPLFQLDPLSTGISMQNSWVTSSGQVSALAFDGSGNLYVAGNFSFASSSETNCIAKWNGSGWTAFGSGISCPSNLAYTIKAMGFDKNNDLYVGGNFVLAGGVIVNNIAKWNGSSWIPLGSGVIGSAGFPAVYALTFDNSGNLYVGGNFNSAGGITVNNIAKWDGNTWSALGSGVSLSSPIYFPEVFALVFDSHGNLYAGGQFTSAGGVPANSIAVWNGANWSPLGSGLTGFPTSQVASLVIDNNGYLYAAGSFGLAGGISASSIAKWDGTRWTALGSGLHGTVSALALDGNNNIIVGGSFSTAGGVPANNIAKWNGNNWITLGSGLNGQVFAIANDNKLHLYVGGKFTSAGSSVSAYIAEWLLDTDGDGIEDSLDCYPFDSSQSTCLPGDYPTGNGFAMAPAGSYAINGMLNLCALGSYTSSAGNSSCNLAPPGTYIAVSGATNFLNCPSGSYNPNSGSTSNTACLQDPAGSYSQPGSAFYTTDPAGTYSSVGAQSPTLCPAGTYNPNTGSTSSAACLQDPAGTYSVAGAAAPTSCPATMTSLAGSMICHKVQPDFNGDKIADVLMRDSSSGNWQSFLMGNNANIASSASLAINASGDYVYKATLDANGDGTADVLTRKTSTGEWVLWTIQDNAVTNTTVLNMTTDPNWSFQAAGDLNGDGTDDIVIRHTTGYWFVYFLKNGQVYDWGSASVFLNADFVLQAVGDMTGDGIADALLRSTSTGKWYLYNAATGVTTQPALWASSDWQFQTLADLNGDGIQDVVLRITNPSATYPGLWGGFIMNSSGNVASSYVLSSVWMNLGLQLAASGDYNGDGTGDLLIRNTNTGAYYLFTTNPPASANPGLQTLTSIPALNGVPWGVLR